MAMILRNGMIKGALGDVIYYVRDGVQYSRTRSRENKSKTPKQQLQRAKFYTVSRFMSEMLDVVKIGWRKEAPQPYSKAFSWHIKNALEDTGTTTKDSRKKFRIDPEKALLAVGRIPRPEITSVSRENYDIRLSWTTQLPEIEARTSDSIVLVAWKKGMKAKSFIDIGNRGKGEGSIVLPYEFQGPVHLWVFYRNFNFEKPSDVMNVSDSVYLGEC